MKTKAEMRETLHGELDDLWRSGVGDFDRAWDDLFQKWSFAFKPSEFYAVQKEVAEDHLKDLQTYSSKVTHDKPKFAEMIQTTKEQVAMLAETIRFLEEQNATEHSDDQIQ
jgi:hypothetical protein